MLKRTITRHYTTLFIFSSQTLPVLLVFALIALIQIASEQQLISVMTESGSNNSLAIKNTQTALKNVVDYAIHAFKEKGHYANIVEESFSLVELLTPLASLNNEDCVKTLSKAPKLAELLANVLSAKFDPTTSGIALPAEQSSILEKALAARCCAQLFAFKTGRGLIENDQKIATGERFIF